MIIHVQLQLRNIQVSNFKPIATGQLHMHM